MVKAVFFDVDGTLVSHTHNAVPESTRISLNKLHEGGIQRVIATGRHLNELSRMPVKGISFDAYMRNPTQSTVVSRPLHHKKRREHHVYSLRFL